MAGSKMMTPDLAILIPTTPDRAIVFNRLFNALNAQISKLDKWGPVQIIVCEDNKEATTGAKRNDLIKRAVESGAKYITFVDDDDLWGRTTLQRYFECIAGGYDTCELWGQIYWSGKPGKPFHHSIEYNDWREDNVKYVRTVNHLNCIKLDLVKDFKFRDQNFGEDAHWSLDIARAGVLKTMYPCKDIIYHYFCGQRPSAGELEVVKKLTE